MYSETAEEKRSTDLLMTQLVSNIRSDLRQGQDRLQVRDQDLARLNQALQNVDTESKRAGESHTSDRMSLTLNVERLNRDLARHEADLDHARSELERKEDVLRQREKEVDTLVRDTSILQT